MGLRVEKLHDCLSAREFQALKFVACGLTSEQIAREMGVKTNSSTTYTRVMLEKLGFTTQSQATLYALHENLVTLDYAYAVMRDSLKEASWAYDVLA